MGEGRQMMGAVYCVDTAEANTVSEAFGLMRITCRGRQGNAPNACIMRHKRGVCLEGGGGEGVEV